MGRADQGGDVTGLIDRPDTVVGLDKENLARGVDRYAPRHGEQGSGPVSFPGARVPGTSIRPGRVPGDRRDLAVGRDAPDEIIHQVSDEQVALVVERERRRGPEQRFGCEAVAEA